MTDTAPEPTRSQRSSFRKTVTLFSVRGVPVRLDRSWVIIAGLVTWIFYGRLGFTLPEQTTVVVALAAVSAALLFFASLLAHELGHALTSLDRDIPVLSITLFLMGGVTESTREARTAKDEFVIVSIGPFISLVLAGLFGLVYELVAGDQPYAAVVGYLAWANLLLAIFNVVPGYPLDGGRLLRSVLWGITGRPHAATRWAARVGQGFGLLLAGFGVWIIVQPGRGGLGGLWELLIGFFLFRGATDAHRRARLQERLAGRTVGELMGSVPPTLDPDMAITAAIEHVQQRPSLPWPVARAGEAVTRAIWLADIDRVPDRDWHTTAIGLVARDARAAIVDAGMALDEALPLLASAPHNVLIVVSDGRPAGLLTPSLIDGLEP